MVNLKSRKLDIYQKLEDRHLTLNKDITEENRMNQRRDIMPWFWLISEGKREENSSWMKECMKFRFIG